MLNNENAEFLAREIENQLPDGIGFCLLLFPFNNENGGRMTYVSNGNREDVANAMKEWLKKVNNNNFGDDI